MRINARLSILRSTACHWRRDRNYGASGQLTEGDLDMPEYPAQYESEAVLSDGFGIHQRPICPDDATRLLDLYHRLSPRSLYHHFFTIPRPDPVYARNPADVDYINRF